MKKIKPKYPKLYRQGDVMLEKIDEVPLDSVLVCDESPVILAHGEVTGHHHAIRTKNARVYKDGETTYVEVGPVIPDLDDLPDVSDLLSKMNKRKVALLTHEEHSPIILVPGVYKVIHQKEYSPQTIRRVAD